MAVIILVFWTQSRYDQLAIKSTLGLRNITQGLAFEQIVIYDPGYHIFFKILVSFLNWCYTNWKGMVFGILLAASTLTLFQSMSYRPSKYRLLNMLQGLFLGFPLGVCVNCATPVAQGMNRAKMPLETLLSTLFASPSLNIVVLSMMFSLLPVYFGVIKLVGFLIFIVCIYFLFEKTALFGAGGASVQAEECHYDPGENRESGGSGKRKSAYIPGFASNLWNVVQISLPFMLLAALLGSTLIEFLPVEKLQDMDASLGLIFIVSLVGTFLPVPIAFDVILVSSLNSIGLEIKFLAALLFTLGIFSIYPYLVLSKEVSKKLANFLFAAVIFIGILASYGTSAYAKAHDAQIRDELALFTKNHWNIKGLVELAEKECSQYFTSEGRKKDLCKTAILENIILYTGDKTVCEQFRLKKMKEGCLSLFQGSTHDRSAGRKLHTKSTETENPTMEQILHETILGGSHKLCYKLSGKKEQSICLGRTFVSRYGFGNDKQNNCPLIPDQNYRKRCLQIVEIKKQVSLGNWNACLNIDQTGNDLYSSDNCFNDAFMSGFLQNGASFCEDIPREDVRNYCWDVQKKAGYQDKRIHQGVSECYHLKKEKKYPLICSESQADQKTLLKQCMSPGKKPFQVKLCLQDHFQTYGFEIDDCSYAKGSKTARVCKDIYHYELAIKLIDPDICYDVKEIFTQDLCLLKVILEKVHARLFKVVVSNFQKRVKKISPQKHEETKKPPEYVSSYSQDTIKNDRTKAKVRLVKDDLVIQGFSHVKRKSYGKKAFTKVSGLRYLVNADSFKLTEFVLPYLYSRGIATGDIDKNGFEDVILAEERKISVFLNQGGMNFEKRQISIDDEKAQSVFLVALVDWNNDTWLDIFFTAYGGGKYVYVNGKNEIIALKNMEGMSFNVSFAAAIYDIDQNRYPDVLVGHWTSGSQLKNNRSHNLLYMNYPDQEKTHRLYEAPGETLSVLFSDVNDDSHVDLLVGNEFLYPDMYYMGNEDGSFELLDHTNSLVSITSQNTMSIDSADFNNDLKLDIFSTDMIVSDDAKENYCGFIDDLVHRKRCRENMEALDIVRKNSPSLCDSINDQKLRHECWFSVIREHAVKINNNHLCRILKYIEPTQYLLCSRLSSQKRSEELDSFHAHFIPQTNSNILLMGRENGTFEDQTHAMNAENTHWSWNSKAADLDNDTWQDIYVGNGLTGFGIQSNSFLHNQKGKSFELREKEFGLEDHLHTPSYSYIDIDNDGDLDMVTRRINAPVGLFLNNNVKGNSITFLLQDNKGNFFALGAKVYIFYGNGKAQLREIKSGGGFMSFNSTRLHFGLGEHKKINRVQILWPDSSKSTINEEFAANHHYVITRTE